MPALGILTYLLQWDYRKTPVFPAAPLTFLSDIPDSKRIPLLPRSYATTVA